MTKFLVFIKMFNLNPQTCEIGDSGLLLYAGCRI